MGLSAYLLLLGVYASAISVSEDSKLRQSIRQAALREPKLLDTIGTAQMEQEIQKRVLAVTRKTQELMTEETGIQSSLSEDDMKHYLEQVIREVRRKRLDCYNIYLFIFIAPLPLLSDKSLTITVVVLEINNFHDLPIYGAY